MAEAAGEPEKSGPDAEAVKRSARFALRDTLLHIAANKRQRACGRFPSNPSGVKLSRYPLPDPAGSDVCPDVTWRARLRGVRLCDMIWTCPVCGPRIRQERAADLERGIRTWVEAKGLRSALFLTLTLPHDYAEPLPEVLADVRAGWSALISGRGRQRIKHEFGIVHYVRSHDMTVGRAGWHPHIHAVLLATKPLDDAAVIRLRGLLLTRWQAAIVARGRKSPSAAHGVTLEVVRSFADVAAYTLQLTSTGTPQRKRIGLEVARGDLKSSRHPGQRTPWQVLGDYTAHPNTRDLTLWREWEQATRTVHAIQWSRGLRAAVGLVPLAEVPTPIEPPAEGEEHVETFPFHQWRTIAFRVGRMSRLLEAAESGGEMGVYRQRKQWERVDATAAGRDALGAEVLPHFRVSMREAFDTAQAAADCMTPNSLQRAALLERVQNVWRRRAGMGPIPRADSAPDVAPLHKLRQWAQSLP